MTKIEEAINTLVLNILTRTQGDISVHDQISNTAYFVQKEILKDVAKVLPESDDGPVYEKLMVEFGYDPVDF